MPEPHWDTQSVGTPLRCFKHRLARCLLIFGLTTSNFSGSTDCFLFMATVGLTISQRGSSLNLHYLFSGLLFFNLSSKKFLAAAIHHTAYSTQNLLKWLCVHWRKSKWFRLNIRAFSFLFYQFLHLSFTFKFGCAILLGAVAIRSIYCFSKCACCVHHSCSSQFSLYKHSLQTFRAN